MVRLGKKHAKEKFMKKYYELGYEVKDLPAPPEYKDYNEWLQKLVNKPMISESNITLRK